ncbi:MAG: TatD family hydrolase [Clostridia bacterium]|nr:TatD family hydrolase [Clostridia bacterium]
MIFESHAHYDDDKYNDDREELLGKMKEGGIQYILNCSSSLNTCEKTIKLTQQYEYIYGSIGVHPSETAELTKEKLEWMKELCKNEKIVAVGEIGLDYYWDEPDRSIQKYWFEEQLKLAREVKLPIIIHSRDAAKDTKDILDQNHAEELGGVIHCFSYSKEMALEYVKKGYYIGIGGVLTFSNAKNLKEVVNEIPIEQIVLETDSPYLAPVPYRGKRNSSFNIPYVIKEIAELKQLSAEEVEQITFENTKKLYRLEHI